MARRKTTAEFKSEFRDKFGDAFTILGEYLNQSTKIEVSCNCCGSVEHKTPKLFLQKPICTKCNNKTLTTPIEKTLEMLSKVHKTTYNVSKIKKATPVREMVEVGCKEHGIFKITLGSLLQGRGCVLCGYKQSMKKTRDTKKEFKIKSNKVHSKLYNYSEVVYTNMRTEVKIKCKRHGIFQQKPKDHIHNKAGCPKCAKAMVRSKDEQNIAQYITKKLKLKIKTSDRTVISPLELDIVIPEFKLAIEYNGVYWHSEAQGKDRYYHKNKTNLCKALGYQLIHIFEDDWNNNKKKIKKYIKHLVGQSKKKPIFGRRTKIEPLLNKQIANEFLDKHHIQGSVNTATYFGIYFIDKLVGVGSFAKGKSNTKNNGMYELTRFATSQPIVGGLGKLISYFRNNVCNKVYTFCDDSFFNGGSYLKAGFTEVSKLAPDYKYVINGQREHKFKWRRKDILVKKPNVYSDNLSESEMMKKANIYRIWDCGKTRFETL